jgi:hypothetical protein
LVVGQGKCIETDDLLEVSFDFFVGQEESYVFKFWQGENENGDNQCLIVEVPVVL